MNAAPVSPDTRQFEDAETGGLEGCFLYAVRPVGSDQREGAIGKIAEVNVSTGQGSIDDAFADHCTAGQYITSDTELLPYSMTPSMRSVPVAEALNGANGVNTKVPGTASPAGAPPAPQNVHRTFYTKPADLLISPYPITQFASITWTMPNAPSDLLGFHVEAAGSPSGPWQRLTKSPVGWWETHYTHQGFVLPGCGLLNAATCTSYRVIAVDVGGNESAPVPASDNPSASACPMTPDPPPHLRASNEYQTPYWFTRLEWDPVPGAAFYTVYRLPIHGNNTFFYTTQVVAAPTTTFLDLGDPLYDGSPEPTCPNNTCAYGLNSECNFGYLSAYYVTARAATGGESPRSNLVFWKPTTGTDPGYVRALPGWDLPADDLPGELLACLNSGETEWERQAGECTGPRPLEARPRDAREPSDPRGMQVAPMTRLGSLPDPPWGLYNLHTDHLGSVRLVTDISTHAVSRHDYFPFGEEIAPTFSYNTHQYTGHERDKESGLDYMLARYYGSGVGRLLSVDPIAFKKERLTDPQRLNLFSYVANNPLRFLDQTGKDISVFYISPGSGGAKESQGHTAVFATSGNSAAGLSYGGKHGFENGKAAFVKAYTDEGRTVTEFKIKSTPAQDSKAVGFIKANPDGGVDHTAIGANEMITQNCTTAVGNTLTASGVVPAGQNPPGSGVLDTPANLKSDLEEQLGSEEGIVESEIDYAPTNPETKKNDVPNKDKK